MLQILMSVRLVMVVAHIYVTTLMEAITANVMTVMQSVKQMLFAVKVCEFNVMWLL